MEFRITGTENDLQAIHQILYDYDNLIQVDEEYGPNEGYQKEPLVVALITIASSAVTSILTAYLTSRSSKKNADVEIHKINSSNETERLKIWLKEKRKWREIELKELELLNEKYHLEKKP